MSERLRSLLTFANVVALLALVMAMVGGAYALSIPDKSGLFHGCVSKRTGALRVVGSATSCHHPRTRKGRTIDPGEYAISWSQQGPRGLPGQPGTVDVSRYYTRTESDGRYERSTRITYGNASSATNGQVVAAWPELGFQITTAGPASVGNIALSVTDIGSQNINGVAMVHNGTPTNTISAFQFGLKPGETNETPYSTAGPFVDFSIVTSSANPEHAADVRCMNVTSGGVTRAHCWVFRSDNAGG